MANPYSSRPDTAFWRRAVSGRAPEAVDPVTAVPFRIGLDDQVATAGSCFAQHISRALAARGYSHMVSEPEADGGAVFSARYGNIYTVRQLRQLADRAFGRFEPDQAAWRRGDGRYVDPFRPRIEPAGFATPEAMEQARRPHLVAVRRMLESCDVLVFTLGLTEAWIDGRDGAVAPFAPGVEAEADDAQAYGFHNFTVAEMQADLDAFIADLRAVNPGVGVILTVSPVPLIATYEDRHVLAATTYSKSALRVVAELASRGHERVAYFPSYEIVTGPQARGAYFAEDAREVTAEGVAQVMDIFARHYLAEDDDAARFDEMADLICDEEMLDL